MKRPPDPYIERLIGRFGETVRGDIEDPDASLKKLNQLVASFAEQLMPHAANEIGTTTSALQRRLARLKLVGSPDVNGYTASSDGWRTFEIGINLGLMVFLHKMAKLFASRTGFMDDDRRRTEHPTVPFERSAAVANRFMNAFWEGKILYEYGFDAMELTDAQLSLAGQLVLDAELFAVAHEFGHVVIKLCPTQVTELETGVEATRALLQRVRGEYGTELRGDEHRWGEEIGADLLGLGLALAAKKSSREIDSQLYSTTWLFNAQSMLETFHEKKHGKSPLGNTHPPSWFRLTILRIYVDRYGGPKVVHTCDAFYQLACRLLAECGIS